MKRLIRHKNAKDLTEQGRIILAHGEQTGHCHEVVPADASNVDLLGAQYFEEPEGRRVLLVVRRCELTHQDHSREYRTFLDPSGCVEKVSAMTGLVEAHDYPAPVRQGDVFLMPIAPGAWEVIRQREFHPEEIRQVMD